MDAQDDPILEAAWALLRAQGHFTMAAVARRAGVSRGTVYRRYADRDRLLARLAEVRGAPVAVQGPRERALDAVGALLDEGGPAALSVEAVARRAGLGPATIYRHFDGRDGLLAAFVDERSPRRLVAALDASPGDDVEGDLSRLAEAGLRFTRAQPGLVRLMLTEGGGAIRRAAQGSRRLQHALTDYFERQVASGRLVGDPDTLAVAFVGMILTIGGESRAEPTEAAALIARMFARGLRPP